MEMKRILDAFEKGENLAEMLSEEELNKLGSTVVEEYFIDKRSRSEWERRMDSAMKLALQVVEKKTTPFENASNVKFPIITIGSLQFSARAYPSLINGTDIVRLRTVGNDDTGEKRKRANRVSRHMSYQVLEEDESWEEEMDKLLTVMPIMGCGFKKSYFDSSMGRNSSVNVLPQNLVINYGAKCLKTATRISELIDINPMQVEESKRMGIYLDQTYEKETQVEQKTSDERQGLTPSYEDVDADIRFIEQHRYLDLDDDGFKEPYVVTVCKSNQKVARIFPRFNKDTVFYRGERVAKIVPIHYYTKYTFLPSPDGGIYDLGWGVLLGPLNESINTSINQLIDAGHLANIPAGFIGRGARMRDGKYKFAPGEFKQVTATGDDLRKNIFTLPIKEPSHVLFQLLSLLIDYAERVSSVSDMMVGQTPGQNTPATTSMAVLEQGMKVYTGIYKRVYRCLKEEFQKLYVLNGIYLDPETYIDVLDDQFAVFQADYKGSPNDVRPSADPSVASETQRLAKAEALRNAAATSPGYNRAAVERRYLEAMNIENIQEIFPVDEQGNMMIQSPPPYEQVVAEEEIRLKKIKTIAEIDKIEAEIIGIQSKAVKDLAQAEAADDKTTLDMLQKRLDHMQMLREQAEAKDNEEETTSDGG